MYTLLKLVKVSRGKKVPSSTFTEIKTRWGPDERTGTKVPWDGKEMFVRERDSRFDQVAIDWRR